MDCPDQIAGRMENDDGKKESKMGDYFLPAFSDYFFSISTVSDSLQSVFKLYVSGKQPYLRFYRVG